MSRPPFFARSFDPSRGRLRLIRRRQGRTSLRRFDGGLLPFGPLLTELSNGRQTNAVAGHQIHSSCREPAVSKSARTGPGSEG